MNTLISYVKVKFALTRYDVSAPFCKVNIPRTEFGQRSNRYSERDRDNEIKPTDSYHVNWPTQRSSLCLAGHCVLLRNLSYGNLMLGGEESQLTQTKDNRLVAPLNEK